MKEVGVEVRSLVFEVPVLLSSLPSLLCCPLQPPASTDRIFRAKTYTLLSTPHLFFPFPCRVHISVHFSSGHEFSKHGRSSLREKD
jgi:hypothetical protein